MDVTAGLFVATVIAALAAAWLWSLSAAAVPIALVAVAFGIAWIVSTTGGPPPKPGSRAAFCDKHDCIGDWQTAHGYRAQCSDRTWSFSGGISGACSGHGGLRQHFYGTDGGWYGSSR